MSRMKRTRTNSDGQSAWSGFGVTARAFTVPEPGWTAVSMKYKSPIRGAIFFIGRHTFAPLRSVPRDTSAPGPRSCLRHGEIGVNRIETLNRDERRTRRTDQVADVDIAQTDSSVDGRFDVAIIEIHLSSLSRRLRFLRVRHCGVVILRGVNTFRPQIRLSLQCYLVQCGLRFRLIDSRLIWARIDREKRIAFLHVGTVLEIARR